MPIIEQSGKDIDTERNTVFFKTDSNGVRFFVSDSGFHAQSSRNFLLPFAAIVVILRHEDENAQKK